MRPISPLAALGASVEKRCKVDLMCDRSLLLPFARPAMELDNVKGKDAPEAPAGGVGSEMVPLPP